MVCSCVRGTVIQAIQSSFNANLTGTVLISHVNPRPLQSSITPPTWQIVAYPACIPSKPPHYGTFSAVVDATVNVECTVRHHAVPPRTALTEHKLALSDVVELYRIGHYASRCINPNIGAPITRLRQFVSAVTSWRVAAIRGDVTLAYLTTGARRWRLPCSCPSKSRSIFVAYRLRVQLFWPNKLWITFENCRFDLKHQLTNYVKQSC